MIRVLVGATALAGAAVPWLVSPHESFDIRLFGLLALLAGLSGLRCVRSAERGTWFVPTDAFVLAAIPTVGGRAACAVALAGLLATSVGVGRAPARRAIFNTGTVLVATAAAAGAFGSLRSRPVGFAMAALSLFLVNTGLVAAAIALDRSRPWIATWRATFLPTLPRFALAALLGAVLAGVAYWSTRPALLLGSLPALSDTCAQALTISR